ncbi:hypothetical protein NL676_006196 [Syzygium grande]|nr:hypothetical protein NL676_006196 [Syzygium grande]
MGRGKLVLELIPKEKARRITYEKRKKGLMKKAQEFTTLCGVDTCMIVYGPAGPAADTEPEIWPASPEKVKLIIEQYKSEGADRRAKRTIGLPEFFANRKRKVDAELTKARLANWEAKYPVSEALIEGLSEEELRKLLGSLGHKLEAAKTRLAMTKEDAMKRYDHHIHDQLYHGLFQNQIVRTPMKQPPLDVNPLHLDLPYHMQQQRQSMFDPDSVNSSIQCPKHCLCGNVLPGQNFQFATLEGGIMHLDTSAYSPILGNVSVECSPTIGECYNVPMVQPAGPFSVMQGELIPTQLMQSPLKGNNQFHDYHEPQSKKIRWS